MNVSFVKSTTLFRLPVEVPSTIPIAERSVWNSSATFTFVLAHAIASAVVRSRFREPFGPSASTVVKLGIWHALENGMAASRTVCLPVAESLMDPLNRLQSLPTADMTSHATIFSEASVFMADILEISQPRCCPRMRMRCSERLAHSQLAPRSERNQWRIPGRKYRNSLWAG